MRIIRRSHQSFIQGFINDHKRGVATGMSQIQIIIINRGEGWRRRAFFNPLFFSHDHHSHLLIFCQGDEMIIIKKQLSFSAASKPSILPKIREEYLNLWNFTFNQCNLRGEMRGNFGGDTHDDTLDDSRTASPIRREWMGRTGESVSHHCTSSSSSLCAAASLVSFPLWLKSI